MTYHYFQKLNLKNLLRSKSTKVTGNMTLKKQGTMTIRELKKHWRHIFRILYNLVKLKYNSWNTERELRRQLERIKAGTAKGH